MSTSYLLFIAKELLQNQNGLTVVVSVFEKPTFHAQLKILRNINFNYLKYCNSGRKTDASTKFSMIL